MKGKATVVEANLPKAKTFWEIYEWDDYCWEYCERTSESLDRARAMCRLHEGATCIVKVELPGMKGKS